MTELSERIREAIAKSGKTQKQIAELSGLTEVSISRYISGEREPRAMTFERIMKVCNGGSTCILTEDEAYGVAQFIDANLYDSIRNDDSIDSVEWLKNILHAYEKMCKASGYVGLTEHVEDE